MTHFYQAACIYNIVKGNTPGPGRAFPGNNDNMADFFPITTGHNSVILNYNITGNINPNEFNKVPVHSVSIQGSPDQYTRISYNTGVTLSNLTSSKFFINSFPSNGMVGIKFVNYGGRKFKLKINKAQGNTFSRSILLC